MSLQRVLSLLNITKRDPGNGGTLQPTNGRTQYFGLITVGPDEGRTLARPAFAGQVVGVCLEVDGGDCTVIVTGGYNEAGNSTLLFTDAGQFASLMGADIDGTLTWRLLAIDASGPDPVYQPIDAELTAIAGLTSAANKVPYFTGSGAAALADLSSVARTLISQGSQADMRGTGLGLGTMATQNAGAVAITGGSITGLGTPSGSSDAAPKSYVDSSVAGLIGAVVYQGSWNASTNSPSLASATGTKGFYYIVGTAGSTALDGISDWKVGDFAIYNGTAWQKIDNTEPVASTSVAGIVELATHDEVATGVDAERAVTPLALLAALPALLNQITETNLQDENGLFSQWESGEYITLG